MVPSEKDRAKFYKTLSSLEKYTEDGLSEKQICSIIRSSVRKSWMQSPVRLLKMMQMCIHDMDPTTRTKWLYPCNHCKDTFKASDVQVDHIKGEHQLKTLADVEQFSRSILEVSPKDLQILCTTCHDIKTYSERHGISFDDAKLEKDVIHWIDITSIPEQKKFLISIGFEPVDVSNHDKRRNAYRSYIKRREP